jgi:hypothetical protein
VAIRKKLTKRCRTVRVGGSCRAPPVVDDAVLQVAVLCPARAEQEEEQD